LESLIHRADRREYRAQMARQKIR